MNEFFLFLFLSDTGTIIISNDKKKQLRNFELERRKY